MFYWFRSFPVQERGRVNMFLVQDPFVLATHIIDTAEDKVHDRRHIIRYAHVPFKCVHRVLFRTLYSSYITTYSRSLSLLSLMSFSGRHPEISSWIFVCLTPIVSKKTSKGSSQFNKSLWSIRTIDRYRQKAQSSHIACRTACLSARLQSLSGNLININHLPPGIQKPVNIWAFCMELSMLSFLSDDS